jgi:dihydrofolate synthase/folylpolyglutamate synthase
MTKNIDTANFDPIEYLNAPRWRHVSLGLERMYALAEALGRPQDSLRFVHVAGTNGKGSTSTYISAVSRVLGNKTGLFTSPYICDFEERIQIDGHMIDKESLLQITLKVREAALAVEAATGEHPTEFELMFAIALVYFAREQCDICVIEVGLGGRLDATNIITPDLCVITPISLDHTAVLGNTLAEVAHEKAGIIKPGVAVVASTQAPEALKVIRDTAHAQGAKLIEAPTNSAKTIELDLKTGTQTFKFNDQIFKTRLLGAYQPANAALAITACDQLFAEGAKNTEGASNLNYKAAVAEGIANAFIPGRFEVLATNPLVIVDGAHNPSGARALCESLDALLGASSASQTSSKDQLSLTFLLGVMADKNYTEMLDMLAPYMNKAFIYTADNPRALPANDLADALAEVNPQTKIITCETPTQAINEARKTANEHEIIIAAGTLYAIGEIKRALSN